MASCSSPAWFLPKTAPTRRPRWTPGKRPGNCEGNYIHDSLAPKCAAAFGHSAGRNCGRCQLRGQHGLHCVRHVVACRWTVSGCLLGQRSDADAELLWSELRSGWSGIRAILRGNRGLHADGTTDAVLRSAHCSFSARRGQFAGVHAMPVIAPRLFI